MTWPQRGWGYMPPTREIFEIFQDIEKICAPRRIFEFGFHAGHSTTYMLESFPGSTINTIGLSSPTQEASVYMKNKYGDRINIFLQDSATINLEKNYYDFALVDGNHRYSHALSDIQKTMRANVPFTLIDNCETTNVAKAVKECYDNNHKFQLLKTYEYYVCWNNVSQWNQMKMYKRIDYS